MSKEIKNITESVMDKIHQDKIKIKPKIYFVIGSIFAFIGLVASIVVSVFLVGLIRFTLRAHGPMGAYKLDQIISLFPWWMVGVVILGLLVGIYLIRQQDFSYKIDFRIIIASLVFAVVLAGLVIDMTGLNDVLFKRGQGQGMGIKKQSLNYSSGHFDRGGGRFKNSLR